MSLPASYGFTSGSPFGFFSVVRTVSLGTTWQDFDVRDPAFSGEADVNAQLVAAGKTAADLQANGVLRSFSIANAHATQDAYLTEFGTEGGVSVNPADAYATVKPSGALTRFHHPRRGLTKTQLRGAGASTTVSVEITFDVLPTS